MNPPALHHRRLITPELWDKLVSQMVRGGGFTHHLAEQTLNETLGFLLLVSKAPQEQRYPPPLIARTWCIFLTNTEGYLLFCTVYAGRFIHHRPPEPPNGQDPRQTAPDILKAMRRYGIAIDAPEIWQGVISHDGTVIQTPPASSGRP